MRRGRSGDTGAAPLLTWRSLGPGWGIRRVRASPRARCAPGRRRRRPPASPPGPSSGRGASASWLTGAGPGLREASPVGGGSSGSHNSPMAPRLSPPRVRAPFLCVRPFPSAPRDRPNWFLRSGIVPPVSLRQPRRAAGARGGPSRPLSFCPSWGRRGAGPRVTGRTTRPRSSLVPSVRSGGCWAPGRGLRLVRSATWQLWPLSAPRVLPPPRGPRSPPRPTRLASLSRSPRPSWPPPGVGDRASPESWRATARPGPELPR